MKKGNVDTDIYTEECHVSMQAKVGVTHPQVKESRRVPAGHQKLERGMGHTLPQIQKEPTLPTLLVLDLGLIASKNVRQYISVVEDA